MTPADRTPRAKNTRPPRLPTRKRAAPGRKPAKAPAKAKALARGKRRAVAKPKTGKPKAAAAKPTRPRKVRVPKAGPRGLKAPAPMVWEVLPGPPPLPIGTSASSASPVLVAKPKRVVGRVLLAGAIVLALALVGLATQVTSEPNTGTIKVHDGPTADPPTRNEPHVGGDLFVEGFNMDADSGDLFFFSWPPTGSGELVLETTWDADDAEPSFHFLAGPFELPCGHYRAGASNGPAEPEDFPGGMKKKTFWVECPDEEPAPEPGPPCGEPGAPPCPPPCGTDDTPPCPPPCGTHDTPPCPCDEPGAPPCPPPCGTDDTPPCPPPCGTDDTPPCPPPCGTDDTPPCPAPEPEPLACPGFSVTARQDGSVEISWTAATGSDGTNIYRAVGDGDFEYVTTVTGDVGVYVDTTTEPGTGYAYSLTGLFGNEESEGCEVVETTAIPEFPTSLGLSLATVGGAVALALAGRRKA